MNINFHLNWLPLVGTALALLAIIWAIACDTGDRPLRRFVRREIGAGKFGGVVYEAKLLHCVCYYSDGTRANWNNNADLGRPVLLSVTVSKDIRSHSFVINKYWFVLLEGWELSGGDGTLMETGSRQYVKLRQPVPGLEADAQAFVNEVLAVIRGDYQTWLKAQLVSAAELYRRMESDDLRLEVADSLCSYIELSNQDGPWGWPFHSYGSHKNAADRLNAELVEPEARKRSS